ncbi:hypothetical protein AeNC1_019611 [Aphanomyces euteiches]|nr:hypothetical protein AeNC1_019611 [Aphanomyces euteiches]
MDSKRKVFEPTTVAQYYESIADCLSFNVGIQQQRAYDRKRRALVHTEGYEAVLNRSKRTHLAFSPYSSSMGSTAGMMASSTSASMSTLKVPNVVGAPMAQPKLQQNILPMNDAVNKQLAPKYVKTASGQTVPVKPGENPPGKPEAVFTIGSEVMVQHTDKLAAYGLAHLIGKKGKVVSIPATKGPFLCGVMFDATLQHVPLEALVSADAGAAAASSAAQMKLPAASQLKLEHSFHMHRLMQDQFKEIQALQKQHAEYRVANNTAAMAEVQKSLAVLRNLHLSQIRVLKGKQEEELRQKEASS